MKYGECIVYFLCFAKAKNEDIHRIDLLSPLCIIDLSSSSAEFYSFFNRLMNSIIYMMFPVAYIAQ
jgi:hypothetical protein